MPSIDKRVEAPDESNRTLIIIVAVSAAVLIAILFYLLMRAGSGSAGGPPVLEGAVRSGSAEWQQHKDRIVVDSVEADEAKRALGDTVMTLRGTVRNFTGRVLNGLEIRAAVVDHQNKAVKERTVIVIPTKQSELAPNRTLAVQVMLEGFKDTDDRANIKMEVTGFRFKN
jgi:hypothetical protein